MVKKRNRSGVALVWMTVLLMAIVGLVALACDTGYWLLARHQLQNVADAAALAGAQQVGLADPLDVRQAAISIASKNKAGGVSIQLRSNEENLFGGEVDDIILGRYHRLSKQFVPTLNAPNAVKVIARRTGDSLNEELPLFFGSMFSVGTVDVQRSAIAMRGGGTGAGLIVLSNTGTSIQFNGTGTTISVGDGDAQINSSDGSAVDGNGVLDVSDGVININGDVSAKPTVFGEMNNDAPQILDPLRHIPEPSYSNLPDLGTIKTTTSMTLEPGYYSGGINASSDAIIELKSGIYHLGGDGLDLSGMAGVISKGGVMIHLVQGATLDLTGGGLIKLTPPDPTVDTFPGADVYEYISIFQARDNTGTSKITGTDSEKLAVDGTIYIPSGTADLSGNGATFGNQLIVNELEVSGNGVINIQYKGKEPAAPNVVFLVE